MFGISLSEIILILIISLIVFGPKQLPQIAKTVGLLIHTLKANIDGLKKQIYQQSGIEELNQAKQKFSDSCLVIKNEIKKVHTTSSKSNAKPKTFQQPDLFRNQPDSNDINI